MGKRKNGKIEFLRFMFALVIMVFHYPTFFKITETAQIGVEFFYIVMGVFMAQKISDESEMNKNIADATMKYIVAKAKSFYKYLCAGILVFIVNISLSFCYLSFCKI